MASLTLDAQLAKADAFKTVEKAARFVSTGYAPQQMAQVSDRLISRAIVPRISRGININDQPARPLRGDYPPRKPGGKPIPGYATIKAKKAPPAIRNWILSGLTLRSMKTLEVQVNRAVIGFVGRDANKRAAINNAREVQFGVSPADSRVLGNEFAQLPPHTRAVAVPISA